MRIIVAARHGQSALPRCWRAPAGDMDAPLDQADAWSDEILAAEARSLFHEPLRESPYTAPRARRAPFLPPRRVPARPYSPLMLPTSRRVQVVLRERHGLGQDALAREERSDRLQSQVRHRLPSSSPSRKDGRHGDSSPAVPRFEACPAQKHHSALLP